MPEKRRFSEKDKTKIFEKMSDFILLMGYNADFQVVIAKELNRHIWMSSENLGLKQCRELLYLLYMADSSTLLSFIVFLGRLVWRSHLRAKRRILHRKLIEKIKHQERARLRQQWRDKRESLSVKLGFPVGPTSRFRVVLRKQKVMCGGVGIGDRIYRLALAMCFLSFRNVCVTSEWEFWAVCLVKQVFGFWRSIAIGGLDGSFTSVAAKFGFDVVSCEHLDRLQSCLRCSSTTHYPGSLRE